MVGLGVYNISEKETRKVVEDALSVGYRSIETARCLSCGASVVMGELSPQSS